MIRNYRAQDLQQLEDLYRIAFPEENLTGLVVKLNRQPEVVLSFVYEKERSVVANIIFTQCAVANNRAKCLLLGPMAVSPNEQRQGIGSAMIIHGIGEMFDRGYDKLLVLGDPAYYGRFGFRQENNIRPAYDIPSAWYAAWQSLEPGNQHATRATDQAHICGRLIVPEPWQDPKLWS